MGTQQLNSLEIQSNEIGLILTKLDMYMVQVRYTYLDVLSDIILFLFLSKIKDGIHGVIIANFLISVKFGTNGPSYRCTDLLYVQCQGQSKLAAFFS